MKKILVVLTGGTIGSRVADAVIDIEGRSPYLLLAMYQEQYGKKEGKRQESEAEQVSFEVINPVTLLSENMTPEVLCRLCQAIDQVNTAEYAGIIVTHGSDTLAYTSAILGLLFHHLPIPLLLVASNYPLGKEGSNGLNNFACAVDFIREGAVRGVFTIYQDKEGRNRVYLATRLQEADPLLDQFRDFSGQAFGEMTEEGFHYQTGAGQPSLAEVEDRKGRELEVPQQLNRRVLLIRPYPGLDYSLFDWKENPPAAVLHYLYHSATACTAGEEYSLLPFVDRCRREGIPFFMASCKQTEGVRYATGDRLFRSGAIPLVNLSPEAAYAKILLAVNQNKPWEPEGLNTDLYFERIL